MSNNPSNAVEFDGGYNIGVPLRSEIREGFGMHQVLLLDFPVPRGTTKRIPPERTPLLYRWGLGPSSLRSFVGYTNHHETLDLRDHQSTSVLRMFNVGTSQTMNAPSPKSWTRVSASYVARQIGEKHGLRTILHRSPEVLDYWTQGNESDFQMMTRLAKRTGFRYWVDGSTQYFLDPQRLVRTPLLNDLQTFYMEGDSQDTVLSLHTISGSLSPGNDVIARSEIYGIDSTTGFLIKATSDKNTSDLGYDTPSSTVLTGYAVDNAYEARRMTEANTATGNWVTIEVTVAGTSKPRLGDVVRLEGGLLPTGSDGLWLVSGTTQVQESTENGPLRLYTTLQLTRNQKDSLTYRTSAALNAPRAVPAVLRHTGRWESQVLEDVYV